MIKYFNSHNSCHILLESSVTSSDIDILETVLSKKNLAYHLEFGRIYNIDIRLVQILYQEIFVNSKKIYITTHKAKLNHYLYDLGFQVIFESLLNKNIVKIKDVDIVLIGGSANSSEKIIEIAKKINLDNMALIFVQHIDPKKNGYFDEILQRYTKHKVCYAREAQIVKKGKIYLAPNNKHLKVIDGYFTLSDEQKYNFSKPSVSISYESFSNYYKERLLVIQECGYANDGVDKMELIKRNNSKLIIQNIDECEAKPMVKNALALNLQDYILTTDKISSYINLLNKKMDKNSWIDYLLEMIFINYEYDFRLYHRDMINRRVDIFMLKHGIKNIKDAVAMILFSKTIFKAFFLDVSINVTEIFREPKSFVTMIKFLNRFYKNSHNIKLWSAGCSSGEEVYSTAILLDSLKLLDKSIIYATDFNSVVLEEAKNGIYSKGTYLKAKENCKEIGFDIELEDYIVENDNYVVINEEIKKKTLFFQHNLIKDGSFNEFDIIICKNVIIYFDKDLQKRVFQLFYDSLKFGGHLVLGESESIIEPFQEKFERCSDNCKVFRKVK